MAKSIESSNRAVIGRRPEKRILDDLLRSGSAEFLAIYGRRRVGKTHLIREYCEPRCDLFFAATGQKDASTAIQLFHFKRELERVFYDGRPLPDLESWESALGLLCDAIDRYIEQHSKRTIVVFLDELPWLATPRSRLLQALDHYWNTRMSRLRQIRLIVCGSAASWILDNLIHAKGGLHNRITRRIRLMPFTLSEVREFLAARSVSLNPVQVVEIYLALGGIPYYLMQVGRGRSAAQNIGAICFDRNGSLFDEFERLFASLFRSADVYEKVIRAIASKGSGIDREELVRLTGIPSGGRLKKRLRELEEAGFIAAATPYGYRAKKVSYRLIDEYISFYLKWIEPAPARVFRADSADYWIAKSRTPAYRAWAGHAFEGVCLKHARQIREALGIQSVAAETGSWRYVSEKGRTAERGAQIDLLFDRADGVITLCEAKYCADEFAIDKVYARELKSKIDVFEKRTGTKKKILLALVTMHGLKRNTWSQDLVDNVVTVEDLFR